MSAEIDFKNSKVDCDSIMADRTSYLESQDRQIELFGPVALPLVVGGKEVIFQWYTFRTRQKESDQIKNMSMPQGEVNSLLVFGNIESKRCPLVRIHSGCQTSEVFGSQRCDCRQQLELAKEWIVNAGAGMIVYVASHEGRNIGLWNKAKAYVLQEQGLDTYAANRALGCPEDGREYKDAATVLKHFLKPNGGIRLITNNPRKQKSLLAQGIRVRATMQMPTFLSQHNQRYLQCKANSGHTIQF